MSPLYYKEPDVTVSWDSLNKWVVAQWRNSPSPQTVRKGCTEILNLLRFQKATAVLPDRALNPSPANEATDVLRQVKLSNGEPVTVLRSPWRFTQTPMTIERGES